MKTVFFYGDPDSRLVAENFCDDVKDHLKGNALPLGVYNFDENIFCRLETGQEGLKRQLLPLQAGPGQLTLDGFLQDQGAMHRDCHVLACWVWTEGRSFPEFLENLAELCCQSQFINQSRRRLVLYVVAPMNHVPNDWIDSREVINKRCGWAALRSAVLVTDQSSEPGMLDWPKEPLDQLRVWLWGSLASLPASDDLMHDFWPATNDLGDNRDTHFSSIGAYARPAYNLKNIRHLYQHKIFSALGDTAQSQTGAAGAVQAASIENLIKSTTAGLENKVSPMVKHFSVPGIITLPLNLKNMEACLQNWKEDAKKQLKNAARENQLSFTKPEGIAEILRTEIQNRIKKFMEELVRHEKLVFNAPVGPSLWVSLPAYIHELREKRNRIDEALKPEWGQWQQLKDVAVKDAAAEIEPAVKKALEKLKQWPMQRLLKRIGLCLLFPVLIGGTYLTLSSIFDRSVPVQSWLILIGLAGAGALASFISFRFWQNKRTELVNNLHKDIQTVFNNLHTRFQGVATQLCKFHSGKLQRVVRGVLGDRVIQWETLHARKEAFLFPPPVNEEGFPPLTAHQAAEIKSSLERFWKNFVDGLSAEKPLAPFWESIVERSLRQEISNAIDSSIGSLDSGAVWDRVNALPWPVPVAKFLYQGGTQYILLMPDGVDRTPPPGVDLREAIVFSSGPGLTLAKMAYRSGSCEQFDLRGQP